MAKQTPHQKAWTTRRKNAAVAKGLATKAKNKKKAAVKLTPHQKAWATRRANEDAWGWSAAAVIAPKKVVNKKVKLVKGLIKNVPHVTRAELDGDFSASEVTAAPVLPVVSSVEELFGDEAERWVKDESAVDSDGDEVEPTAPEAYAFCLSGAVTRVYGEGTDAEAQACDKLTDVIDKYSFGEFRDLPGFNDDNNTTFEDIRRVVALAGV